MFRYVLLSCAFLLSAQSAFAKIGMRDPNTIYFGENGYVISRRCADHLTDPTTNCELQDQKGIALPVPISLAENDFKEALLQTKAEAVLTARENVRFVGPNGIKNLDADIELYEKRLLDVTLDVDDIARTKDVLAKLQNLLAAFQGGDALITRIKSTDTHIVPSFDKNIVATQSTFTAASKRVLIFDPINKGWWAYLGQGDYYDATGTRRYKATGYSNLDTESENQSNLGGCKARHRDSLLPSIDQLHNINRQAMVAQAIKTYFGAGYNGIWSNTSSIVGEENLYNGRWATFGKHKIHAIICMVPVGN